MPFFETHSLVKAYGTARAVDGLSFGAERGRVTGLLGVNGAGKTTTLNVMLGLVNPTSGEGLVDGRPYAELAEPLRAVGAVLEHTGLHPKRSGRDHLLVTAKAAGVPPGRADEVLALVHLDGSPARQPVGEYSLGMRQRLVLGAALLPEPGGLVLDEPANGLDPPGIRWLRDLLRSQAADGRAVLVSSHALAEVAQTVDDVVILDRGRHVASGTLDEIRARARSDLLVRSSDPSRLAGALREEGATVEPLDGDRLVAHGVEPERAGRLAMELRIEIYELSPRASTLEQAFLELVEAPGGGDEARSRH